jgi:hypothetical protein
LGQLQFVLHHVLKELSSKRLVEDYKAFAEVSLKENNLQETAQARTSTGSD